MSTSSLHIFGIRHHGQGSAKRLQAALRQLQPDCIVIEAPQDAEKMIEYAAHPDMRTPLAICVYAPKDFQRVTYYPFASFSPEWLAIQYALTQDVEVRFMDLPMNMQYALDGLEYDRLKELLKSQQTTDQSIVRDPLGHLARLAGYEDSERWWDVTFEQASEQAVFETILEMMTELRGGLGRLESAETLRREAFMRKVIRKAHKDGFERIAVVCGAWHSPVLSNLTPFPQSKDNALLKGIKKVKTAATWIPWTDERLATQSGYGAGIVSPAWYRILFQNSKEESSHWMIRATRLLRRKDIEVSAAHAVEGVRLANTLAAMRELSLPGLEELKEAAITVLCEGSEVQWQLIEQAAIVGERVGRITKNVPQVPLQKDLDQALKSSRLNKYWGISGTHWLKGTKANPRGGIDLREEKDREKSYLLHRLQILDILWGSREAKGEYDKGDFKEYWKLKWKPDFAIKVIEASVWGSTIVTAAEQKMCHQVQQLTQLDALIRQLELALYADLPNALQLILQQIQAVSAEAQDVVALMDALLPTIRISRYGSTRQLNQLSIDQLIESLIPRICVGLPNTCINISEELALTMSEKIRATQSAIHLLPDTTFRAQWYTTLTQIVRMNDNVAGHTHGTVTRLLFERKQLALEEIQRGMSYQFSIGSESQRTAQWLEGFLQGSGLVLLHYPNLWKILDEWLIALDEGQFEAIVPLLRRAFSQFSPVERRKMMERARQQEQQSTESTLLPQSQQSEVAEAVGLILGWRAVEE
ncbi:MAG: DUF5682 family protein [Bacteroidota bacterium]